jgi:hypothetical protein
LIVGSTSWASLPACTTSADASEGEAEGAATASTAWPKVHPDLSLLHLGETVSLSNEGEGGPITIYGTYLITNEPIPITITGTAEWGDKMEVYFLSPEKNGKRVELGKVKVEEGKAFTLKATARETGEYAVAIKAPRGGRVTLTPRGEYGPRDPGVIVSLKHGALVGRTVPVVLNDALPESKVRLAITWDRVLEATTANHRTSFELPEDVREGSDLLLFVEGAQRYENYFKVRVWSKNELGIGDITMGESSLSFRGAMPLIGGRVQFELRSLDRKGADGAGKLVTASTITATTPGQDPDGLAAIDGTLSFPTDGEGGWDDPKVGENLAIGYLKDKVFTPLTCLKLNIPDNDDDFPGVPIACTP